MVRVYALRAAARPVAVRRVPQDNDGDVRGHGGSNGCGDQREVSVIDVAASRVGRREPVRCSSGLYSCAYSDHRGPCVRVPPELRADGVAVVEAGRFVLAARVGPNDSDSQGGRDCQRQQAGGVLQGGRGVEAFIGPRSRVAPINLQQYE